MSAPRFRITYDVNTNTDYNPDAEREAGDIRDAGDREVPGGRVVEIAAQPGAKGPRRLTAQAQRETEPKVVDIRKSTL